MTGEAETLLSRFKMLIPPQREIRNELVGEVAPGPFLITKGLSFGLGMYTKKLSEGSDEIVEAIEDQKMESKCQWTHDYALCHNMVCQAPYQDSTRQH